MGLRVGRVLEGHERGECDHSGPHRTKGPNLHPMAHSNSKFEYLALLKHRALLRYFLVSSPQITT